MALEGSMIELDCKRFVLGFFIYKLYILPLSFPHSEYIFNHVNQSLLVHYKCSDCLGSCDYSWHEKSSDNRTEDTTIEVSQTSSDF